MSKIYLKDTQSFNNDSFKIGDKSGSKKLSEYVAANRLLFEFEWNLSSSVVLSKQGQQKRIGQSTKALSLNDEQMRVNMRLGQLKECIKRLGAKIEISALKQQNLSKNLKNSVSLYTKGNIKYGEFLYSMDKNLEDRSSFIFDIGEFETAKVEYFYERGD
ncbi:hypothetical protein KDD93_05425 [Campylobacter sp. faydin G-24]|uniref:Uncharacterized protein n=1 Tax=Campylobacter anatolicus TaxID=2829105 RepID=A0ABS5HIZ2_9BACT|nr:hypothetical protein [Campylobacter anatolicus]MBR8464011.1 hypothetical protein [Campylobacter anatolicus]